MQVRRAPGHMLRSPGRCERRNKHGARPRSPCGNDFTDLVGPKAGPHNRLNARRNCRESSLEKGALVELDECLALTPPQSTAQACRKDDRGGLAHSGLWAEARREINLDCHRRHYERSLSQAPTEPLCRAR